MPKQGQQKGTPARRAEFVEHLQSIGPGRFCVNWPWSMGHNRYISVHIDGEKVLAHRWVYEQINGSLPHSHRAGAAGVVVMHTCDNKSCVRPSHLVAGTQVDNIQDAVSKGRMRPGTGKSFGRKLSDDDVAMIRRMAAQAGVRQSDLARAFGVSDATVSLIVNNKKRVPLVPTITYHAVNGRLVEGGRNEGEGIA